MGAQASQFSEINNGAAANLTPTQIKVLQGVSSGRLNKQIAYDLGIAEATVKAHMTALMRKLNVRNRTQVAVVAQRLTHMGVNETLG
ncbi:MAG: response regulator transcription factor [Sphingomonas sp.]